MRFFAAFAEADNDTEPHGCAKSQFEQVIRALQNLMAGSRAKHFCAVVELFAQTGDCHHHGSSLSHVENGRATQTVSLAPQEDLLRIPVGHC